MQIRALERPHNKTLRSNEWDPGIPKYVLAQSLRPPALPESPPSTYMMRSGPQVIQGLGPGHNPANAAGHRAQLPSTCARLHCSLPSSS